MNDLVLKWTAPIHRKYRKEKCDLFFTFLRPSPRDSLLDVGGDAGVLSDEFARIYSFFGRVKVVNTRPQSFSGAASRYVSFTVADACALPYSDRSFDWVFSNAVIEHIGDALKQLQMAVEIRRVARKGYFVATPNRAFPIDPHTLLPFYHFLNPAAQRYLSKLSLGHMKHYETIRILSARDLLKMFPDGSVRKCGTRLFPNNLVVYRGDEPE